MKKPQATATQQPRAAGITQPTTRERAYGAVASGAAHRYEPNPSSALSSLLGGPHPEQVEVVWDTSIMPITKAKMPQREQVTARYRYTPLVASTLAPWQGSISPHAAKPSGYVHGGGYTHTLLAPGCLSLTDGRAALPKTIDFAACLKTNSTIHPSPLTLLGWETPTCRPRNFTMGEEVAMHRIGGSSLDRPLPPPPLPAAGAHRNYVPHVPPSPRRTVNDSVTVRAWRPPRLMPLQNPYNAPPSTSGQSVRLAGGGVPQATGRWAYSVS